VELKAGSLILVDIDNTLTTSTSWTEQDCLFAPPNKRMIDWVNARYRDCCTIIIYTARREDLREATKYWLKKNNVNYHAIRFNKIPCDIFIDDKACRPEEILGGDTLETTYPNFRYVSTMQTGNLTGSQQLCGYNQYGESNQAGDPCDV